MSVRSSADTALNLFLSILWLPGRVIEEGLHALASMPWADEISIRVRPRDGEADTLVHFADDTPQWAIRLAYILPEVVASVAGLAVITWWLLSGAVWWPTTLLDWTLLSILGAQWIAIALPSAADMDQTPEVDDVQHR